MFRSFMPLYGSFTFGARIDAGVFKRLGVQDDRDLIPLAIKSMASFSGSGSMLNSTV